MIVYYLSLRVRVSLAWSISGLYKLTLSGQSVERMYLTIECQRVYVILFNGIVSAYADNTIL